MKNEQQLTVLRNSLVRQNEQGNQMMEIVDNLLQMERRVDSKIESFDLKLKNHDKEMNEFKSDVHDTFEEIKKEVTINYDQQKEVQSAVSSLANGFTETFYSDGMPEKVPERYHDDLFKKKKGRYIRRIYARLKTRFNVVRYTAIRKVDYKSALDYIENITFDRISPKEVEDLKSWNIPGLFPDEE